MRCYALSTRGPFTGRRSPVGNCRFKYRNFSLVILFISSHLTGNHVLNYIHLVFMKCCWFLRFHFHFHLWSSTRVVWRWSCTQQTITLFFHQDIITISFSLLLFSNFSSRLNPVECRLFDLNSTSIWMLWIWMSFFTPHLFCATEKKWLI